jgi:hypothetical protein
MIIEQVVKEDLEATSGITDLVGPRIYLQSNDQDKNNFPDTMPLITFIPIVETINTNTKLVSPFQITARANTYLEAVTIANLVVELFQDKITVNYNNSVVRSKSRIYDRTLKAHGVALTIDFIYKKK